MRRRHFPMHWSAGACLFDATRTQMNMADQIVKSHTASHTERQNAQRRYGDAARQYAVLLKNGNTQNSDFYTYRYLASQGFLPGYNFPRLPLMAWIPARGGATVQWQGRRGQHGQPSALPGLVRIRPTQPDLSPGPHVPRGARQAQRRVRRSHLRQQPVGDYCLAGLQSVRLWPFGRYQWRAALVNCCENCDALLTEHDWVRELYRIETVKR
jgi:hypothetical protein